MITDVTEQAYEEVFGTNVLGTLLNPKHEFRAMKGRGERCACQKSNSHIQIMKSAKKWRRQNATNGMYGSRRRRVLVE